MQIYHDLPICDRLLQFGDYCEPKCSDSERLCVDRCEFVVGRYLGMEWLESNRRLDLCRKSCVHTYMVLL